eukprot:Clim_evm40s25 gene=Clim_evmTU40s25
MVRKGDWVWVPLGGEVRLGARILSLTNGGMKVRDEDERILLIPREKFEELRPMNPAMRRHYNDMIDLPELHDGGLLHNLRQRYQEGIIYTYTAQILVALNPYKQLDIYGEKVMIQYRGNELQDRDPHVYAVCDQAYERMRKYSKPQALLISGESGAGKTETTKLALRYFIFCSRAASDIESLLTATNPIFEALGNAKTLRNDNSSRFGKFLSVEFKGGNITHASAQQFLLERSRLTFQSKGERNYHIFYQLVAGASETLKSRLFLKNVKDFKILTGGDCVSIDGVDDAVDFQEVIAGMKALNISDDRMDDYFTVLALLLHLGNLEFTGKGDGSSLKDSTHLQVALSLLGLEKSDLEDAICVRTTKLRHETYKNAISVAEAAKNVQILIQGVYASLFSEVVDAINMKISQGLASTRQRIGVLDIFGFEVFEQNSFEQLCINYANEALQQVFVQFVFKIEQDIYREEGINWETLDFQDNEPCLKMLFNSPVSIINLIDEETFFPRGTDESLYLKLEDNHNKDPYYQKLPGQDTVFGVHHYAGDVHYDCEGFLEKNKNRFGQDLLRVVTHSNLSLLTELFRDQIREIEQGASAKKKGTSVAARFAKSLQSLLKTLAEAEPSFIRCVKPNTEKKPLNFKSGLVLKQLRYSGMMETINVRKNGYAIRYEFADFVNVFWIVAPSARFRNVEMHEKCEEILNKGLPDQDWQIGYTKVFLKMKQAEELSRVKGMALRKYVVKIQRAARAWLDRKHFLEKRSATIAIQKWYRCARAREQYLYLRVCVRKLQNAWRVYKGASRIRLFRETMAKLTAMSKGYLVRQWLAQQKYIKAQDEARALRMAQYNANQMDDIMLMQATAMISSAFDFLEQEPEPIVEDDEEEGENTTSIMETDPEPADDISANNFKLFARQYFNGLDPFYTRQPLKRPLLALRTEQMRRRALKIFVHIQKFMGDIVEPKYFAISAEDADLDSPVDNRPCRKSKNARKEGRLSNSSLVSSIRGSNTSLNGMGQDKDGRKKRGSNISLGDLNGDSGMSRSSSRGSLFGLMKKKKDDDRDSVSSLGQLSGLHAHEASDLRKEDDIVVDDRKPGAMNGRLRAIIEPGIVDPNMRDEILCQIIKQLHRNPSASSRIRGFILLILVMGCFPPSQRFLPTLRAVLYFAPRKFVERAQYTLERCIMNGPRLHSPSVYETNMVKLRQPIAIKVMFVDDRSHNFVIDMSTTAKEVVHMIKSQLRQQNRYGFSLFISVSGIGTCIGSGNNKILDWVARAERRGEQMGIPARDNRFVIYYKKEMFPPWNEDLDAVSVQLEYLQITFGVASGAYPPRDEVLVNYLAMRIYIEFGGISKRNARNIEEVIPGWLPQGDEIKPEKWIRAAAEVIKNSSFAQRKASSLEVQQLMIDYIVKQYPLQFTRIYKDIKFLKPYSPDDAVAVAVGRMGIFVINENLEIMSKVAYADIIAIEEGYRLGSHKTRPIIVRTFSGVTFIMVCESNDFKEFITDILREHGKRSKYAVAKVNFKSPDDPSLLSFRPGDLITILKRPTKGRGLCYGECERTGAAGYFPLSYVHVLPVNEKPTPEMMNVISNSSLVFVQAVFQHNTLEEFAADYFTQRPDRKKNVTLPWEWDKNELPKACLKHVAEDPELEKAALAGNRSILRFMGDMSRKSNVSDFELLNNVVGLAIKVDALRDEIFSQVTKQITNNSNTVSEAKGWELMFALCGVTYPTPILISYIESILNCNSSRRIAAACLTRLHKIRRLPKRESLLHPLEYESVRNNAKPIHVEVHLPDTSYRRYEVFSYTRRGDLLTQVAHDLDFRSLDGFALFVRFPEEGLTACMHRDCFLFDFMNRVIVVNNIRIDAPFHVLIRRRAWRADEIGEDPVADNLFHYWQTIPNLHKGYYDVSRQEAIMCAVYQYIVKYGDDLPPTTSQVKRRVQRLMPTDLLPNQDMDQLVLDFQKAYRENRSLPAGKAKRSLLDLLKKHSAAGVAYFDGKQVFGKSSKSIVIGISPERIEIYEARNRGLLTRVNYGDISNWYARDDRIVVKGRAAATGEAVSVKFTSRSADEISDLITAYGVSIDREEHARGTKRGTLRGTFRRGGGNKSSAAKGGRRAAKQAAAAQKAGYGSVHVTQQTAGSAQPATESPAQEPQSAEARASAGGSSRQKAATDSALYTTAKKTEP